ncbi:pentapeptide repeat-containing protein [Streptomyces sp. NPDC020681]|uniref:pentapeptide repeat-containing protein n=1 Tax=Streptomyces sp. NPDC020681 TaxID=3365083 RepID=UPI00379F0B4E
MASASAPPRWPHCGKGANPSDRVGCRGRRVDPYTACLAHLADDQRDAYLASLSPGSDLDHRGTEIDELLLVQLLDAMRDPNTRHPMIGATLFGEATFTGAAQFSKATFTSTAQFSGATFTRTAKFGRATFTSTAWFRGATFTSEARFNDATCTGTAWFDEATFAATAWFNKARFTRNAQFGEATFAGTAVFDGVAFAGTAVFDGVAFADDAGFSGATFTEASFRSVVFERASRVGPLTCARVFDLSAASFGAPVTIEAASRSVVCQRARWAATAGLRLRYADVDLTDAVFEYPLSIAAHTRPFIASTGEVVLEDALRETYATVRMLSLQGVDAAHLVLTDLDLSACRFAGTVHLDQLRLEGRMSLAQVPEGVHRRRWGLVRFTQRRTLAEEQYWRAAQPGAVPGWAPVPDGTDPVEPAALTAVYRSLRKAFEDSKNEPGAADFYYGEMEMRRADQETPRAERWLLAGYWALSGYGLRASRALAWLLLAMTGTVLAMMLWGLATEDPEPVSRGTVKGSQITLTTKTADPVNPDGPLHRRLTTERFDKSLRVVVNSVVFRSSGQDLTTAGTYTEMVSRLTEPVLLGLAVLAIRGRVKR